MNECKARNKELHLHIEELQMRVGGWGGWGVCTRGWGRGMECVPEGGGGVWSVYQRGLGRVWRVYQDKESWPGSIARMRDSL